MPEMTEPEKNAPKKNAPAEATPAPPSFTPAPVVPDAPEPARAGPPAATIVALVVLLAGLIWLWRQDTGLRHRLDAVQAQLAAAQTVDPARVSAVESALDAVRQQVAALQARPLPPPAPDLKPLDARIAALEKRPPPDLKPLDDRIAALEKRPPPDLTPLETRIAALEQRKPPDLGPLEDRVAALERKKPEDPALEARVAGLAAAQQATQQQTEAAAAAAHATADHAARLQAVQQAQVSLAAGQPLGNLPDAPPALAQFAATPPPTEAALRLSFPQAARAAVKASQPSTQGLSVLQRMWQRAEALVTIRKGDRVILGTPASTTLAAARVRLDAGDLAGAVAALDKLDPRAAQAMATWRGQAQALLDARAALAAMAAG